MVIRALEDTFLHDGHPASLDSSRLVSSSGSERTACQDTDGDTIFKSKSGPQGSIDGNQITPAGQADNNVSRPNCFGPDALIATRAGLVRAIDIAPGDMVITRDHGYREVAWTSSTRVNATGLYAPIHFAAGAINNSEELLLSPEHRLLVAGHQAQRLFGEPEVLVAAKHLRRLPGASRREGGQITYVHFMFERHEIVFANGVGCESFYPGDIALDACDACQREEIYALFPNLKAQGQARHLMARRSLRSFEAAALINAMA